MFRWANVASKARKVKELEDKLKIAQSDLNLDLDELSKESKKHRYSLWHKEDGTYFWENEYRQIANYPTLAEAVVAYGTETIDFGR